MNSHSLTAAQAILQHKLQSDPNFAKGVANNPQAQEMIRCIQSGDVNKGTEIATNLHNSFGNTREETLDKAKQFFNL